MNYNGKAKRWLLIVLIVSIIGLVFFTSLVIIVAPFFHYHGPVKNLAYELDCEGYNSERYIGDGIVRHFEYDAIITGTSMSEHFKTSDFENIFGMKAVKVCYSGGFTAVKKNAYRSFYETGC